MNTHYKSIRIMISIILILIFAILPITDLYLLIAIQSLVFLVVAMILFIPPCGIKCSYKKLIFHYLSGMIAGISLISIIILLLYMFKHITLSRVEKISYVSLIGLVFIWMLQSFVEEYLFRGVLFEMLNKKIKLIYSVIVSSLIFSAFHIANLNVSILAIINIFLFGIICALIVIITKNIYFVSAIHFAWNYCQGHVYGTAISGNMVSDTLYISNPIGDKLMTGDAFGIEGSLMTTIIFVFMIFTLIIYLKFKKCAIINSKESEE